MTYMESFVQDRLRPIEYLNEQFGPSDKALKLMQIEQRAQYVHEKYEILPTIGCEVEVKWSSLFPVMARDFFGERDEFGAFEHRYEDLSPGRKLAFDQVCARLDRFIKPRYEATKQAGIPSGSDAYWEFANAPTYSWQTLAEEVGLLMKGRLIPEGYPHALHITLGGVNPEGGGMSLVLSGLELQNAQPERITAALRSNRLGTSTAWDRRGQDGMRTRLAGALSLGQTIGTELRTLATQNTDDINQTLFSAQMLTTVLQAYRQRHSTDQNWIKDLASMWSLYRFEINDLWQRRGLPAQSWGPPQKNPLTWQTWAECLGRADEPGSRENKLKQLIGAIGQTTTQILNSLD